MANDLLTRMHKALDEKLIELITDEQKSLALRLGADATFVNPAAEYHAAELGTVNAKVANKHMHEIVVKVFLGDEQ